MRTEPESDQEELSSDEEEDGEPQGRPPAKRRALSALAELLGDSYANAMPEPSAPVKSPFDTAQEEVTKYREAAPLCLKPSPPDDDNGVVVIKKKDKTPQTPLEWWKENQPKYPLLAKLAKQYLCVPGTSVPSERVFSTAGDIVTAQRSSLTSEHVDQLLFLQKNLITPKY